MCAVIACTASDRNESTTDQDVFSRADITTQDSTSADDIVERSDTTSVDDALNAQDAGTAPVDDIQQSQDTAQIDDNGGSSVTDTTLPPEDSGVEDDTSEVSEIDPGSTGPFGFESSSDSIVVGQGMFGEETTLEIISLVPEGDNNPVVLFMPGAQLTATDYTSTREHLASYGFAVVFPSFSDGSLLDIPDAHVSLQQDVGKVLDWIENQAAGAWAGKIDPTRLAAVGHSLGGKLSFLVATSDDRIDAIAGIDPVDSGPPSFVPFDPAEYPSVAPELMDLITVPMLIMGETLNGSGGFQPCAPAEDNFQQYYAAATAPALMIDFINANHMSFLDDPNGCAACSLCPSGTDDPATTRLLMRRFLIAFLASSLNDNNEWNAWLFGALHSELVTEGLISSEYKNGFDTAL